MIWDAEEKAFNEGYRLALKRLGALESGEYSKDWVSSETAKEVYSRRAKELQEQSAKFPVTTGLVPFLQFSGEPLEIIPPLDLGFRGGCVAAKYCNECFTEHWSSICVCGMSECSKCGATLSQQPLEGKEYKKERI